MWHDLVVEEIWRIRYDYARKFEFDLHAICEDLRKRQVNSDREIITHPPRKPVRRKIAA